MLPYVSWYISVVAFMCVYVRVCVCVCVCVSVCEFVGMQVMC